MSDTVCNYFYNGDKELLTFYSEYYPRYQEGDIVWLKKSSLPGTRFDLKDEDKLPLTRYKVVRVEHSVHMDFMNNIVTIVRQEIYLKPYPLMSVG